MVELEENESINSNIIYYFQIISKHLIMKHQNPVSMSHCMQLSLTLPQ
jgi:hypothetical protein